jgi:DNA repair exonuclease SbcCD ATPase subunit
MKPSNQKNPTHIHFDTVSPATKLLEKRRMMYEVHEAFEAQKEEFKKQESNFKVQEAEIRNRDLQIQEDLIKFCRYLQENDSKKIRAEKRFADEQKARVAKEQEIKELQAQLQELQKNSSKLERKVNSLKKYEEYLDLVYKTYPDQYTDMNEIINRYKQLETSNKTLETNHSEIEKKLEKLRNEAQHFEKEMTNEILQLNNDIAIYQKKQEELVNKKSELQALVDLSNNEASTKNLTLGRILMAIDNIYSRCLEGTYKMRYEYEGEKPDAQQQQKPEQTSTKQMAAEPNDAEYFQKKGDEAIEKLKKIGNYMSDFARIITECRKEKK